MNLMLAYLEGADSLNIDDTLRKEIASELSVPYATGIKGMDAVYKPVSGTHMKVDISALRSRYFSNIRMYDSEIFSYALNKAYGVSTLHAFQIMDPSGSTLRLCFGDKGHVHRGMRAMHNFIKSLTDIPAENQFFPGVKSIEEIIYPSQDRMDEIIRTSRERAPELKLLPHYRYNVRSRIPSYVRLSLPQLDQAINKAAFRIQAVWHSHRSQQL